MVAVRFTVFLVWSQLWAQSIQILPAPPTDKAVGFQIMIVCPPATPLVAVQWRLSVAGGVAPSERQIQVGAAASDAGKSLTCAGARNEEGKSICVVAGGERPIGNGPLAVARFVVPGRASSLTVRVSEVLGATGDGKPVRIPDVELTIPTRNAEK